MPTKKKTTPADERSLNRTKATSAMCVGTKSGQFNEEVDVGRSLAADRRSQAKTTGKKGQGDRGDVKR